MVFNEKIDYDNPLLSLRVFLQHRVEPLLVHWHYHKEIEILAVHSGSLEVHIENETYVLNSGDVVLIGMSQLHRDRNDGDTVYTVLQFDIPQYFDKSLVNYLPAFTDPAVKLSGLNYMFAENPSIRREIYRCVQSIYEEIRDQPKGYEIAVNLWVKQILLILLRGDTRQILGSVPNHEIMRLKPVFELVERNIDGKIAVEDVCGIVNMSYYYFVKYFKRVMGMSFTEFVNFKKIKKAEQILLTQETSVAEVGELIGMPNMAHFYKMFKKYNGCSPHAFRRQMANWSPDRPTAPAAEPRRTPAP